MNEKDDRMSSWGYKFEQYVQTDQPTSSTVKVILFYSNNYLININLVFTFESLDSNAVIRFFALNH